MNKLSIIIPVYNLEKYIGKCLDSIIKQLPLDGSVQVYTIDDGSKDHSKSVIQSYVEKNHCIHYVYKENGGVSSARNLGLELIDSEYVTFIDGDDWVSDDYLSIILDELKKEPELLCFNYFIASDTKSVQNVWVGNEEVNLNPGDGMNGFLHFQYQKTIRPFIWNKIYKLETIRMNHCRFDENKKFAEDMLFNADYLECIKTYRTIDKSLYYYYQREGSTIHSYKSYFVDDTLEFIKIYNGISSKHHLDLDENSLYTFYLSRYFGIINNEGKSKQFKKGWKQIQKYLNYTNFKNDKLKRLDFPKLDLKCKAYSVCIQFHFTFLIYTIVYLRYLLG